MYFIHACELHVHAFLLNILKLHYLVSCIKIRSRTCTYTMNHWTVDTGTFLFFYSRGQTSAWLSWRRCCCYCWAVQCRARARRVTSTSLRHPLTLTHNKPSYGAFARCALTVDVVIVTLPNRPSQFASIFLKRFWSSYLLAMTSRCCCCRLLTHRNMWSRPRCSAPTLTSLSTSTPSCVVSSVSGTSSFNDWSSVNRK